MTNDLFYDCSTTWWWKFLFVGNLVGKVDPVRGCGYWMWSIQCDMQLTLLVPLFVQLFRYRSAVGYIAMFCVTILSIIINMTIVAMKDIRSGALAIETEDVLDVYLSKPWTKFFATAIGVSFA